MFVHLNECSNAWALVATNSNQAMITATLHAIANTAGFPIIAKPVVAIIQSKPAASQTSY